MLSRMKYIHRWGLMRNSRPENLCEHSYETAVLAHALCLLRNRRFGGHVNPERAAALALFHDCTEILTGDLPTPVKYGNQKFNLLIKKSSMMPLEDFFLFFQKSCRETIALSFCRMLREMRNCVRW